jgi:hypothetical protein
VVPLPRVDAEYETGNWFTVTHPGSAFANNLIAARPGPGWMRLTVRPTTGEASGTLYGTPA